MKKRLDKAGLLILSIIQAWFIGGVVVIGVIAAGELIDLAWERLEGIGLPIVMPVAFIVVGHFVRKAYKKYFPNKEVDD